MTTLLVQSVKLHSLSLNRWKTFQAAAISGIDEYHRTPSDRPRGSRRDCGRKRPGRRRRRAPKARRSRSGEGLLRSRPHRIRPGPSVSRRRWSREAHAGKSLAAAKEDVGELHEAASALGMGPGAPGANDPKAVAALFKRVRFGSGAEVDLRTRRTVPAGGAVEAAPEDRPWSRRHGWGRTGGDLARLLPHELATDESGSMQGEKAHTAKALALALAWIARQQNRWCALVAYSGDSGERLLALPPSRWDESALANWLTAFIGRGSDLDVPVRELPRLFDLMGVRAVPPATARPSSRRICSTVSPPVCHCFGGAFATESPRFLDFRESNSLLFSCDRENPIKASVFGDSDRWQRWRSLAESVATSGDATACAATGTLPVPVAFAEANSRLEHASKVASVRVSARSSIAQHSWVFMA